MGFEIFTKIDENDNVAIANIAIMKGDVIPLSDKTITAKAEIPEGTIFALDDIKKGEYIIKYGFKSGIATSDILHGESLSSYNYTTKLPDIEKLCASLSESHKAYIAQKKEGFKDYSLRFSGYDTNGKVGLLKAVVVLASEEYATLLDENSIVVDEDTLSSYLESPNLALSLILGFDYENSENIIALKTPTKAEAEEALSSLKERALCFKKSSFPITKLTVELYGPTTDPCYNHMIGNMVDDLICLGVNVIVDITGPIGKAVYLIKEKLIDKAALKYIPFQDDRVDDDTELNFIQLLGKGEIETVVNDDNAPQKGLNICFKPKFNHSQIILDLTGELKATPLSPVLDMTVYKKGQEITVESLLFDINRIMSKNI